MEVNNGNSKPLNSDDISAILNIIVTMVIMSIAMIINNNIDYKDHGDDGRHGRRNW